MTRNRSCIGSLKVPTRTDRVLRSGECPFCGERFSYDDMARAAGRHGGGERIGGALVPLQVPMHLRRYHGQDALALT